ncbi:nonribosomal peptide synthetase-like protein 2 [Delitschia confertaspora ATCC 74209]|uniref:Nonribosomal peptide synthetase-like protein 2 n=1 Tax=Delitschia confertaspora ATCC 74209 TaxID=1513339 RepID=A0A9P4JZY5_9PLEO|nr:nonribosomal peptide synthetase-like protein 2 [Delitschia confertaspora ATCC 74209]
MASESHSGLSILNQPPSQLEGPQLLHDLVRKTSTTGVPAIDFLENGTTRRTLSYESLHSLSDGLAGRICHLLKGLEHGSPIVPLLLPQSLELYITQLAILKAGKAFCPLNLDAPAERVKFILKDVSANLLITTSLLKDTLPPIEDVRLLVIDEELYKCEEEYEVEGVEVQPEDLAYVLYTSGSTGLPKAVSLPHRAVTQSLLAHDRHIPSFSRFLQFAAPTFDVSIFEVFFPLFRGCTLVGCSRAQMLNDLPAAINELEVDAAELTPTVAGNLLRGRESVPGLKLLLTIGEMLTQHIVQEYGGSESRKSILWGMYGPTEAAIHCTLQPAFQSASSPGNIGFPFDTVSAFIVEPVSDGKSPSEISVIPIGETGELVVGGQQVAREYLNRPEITAAAFIHHPDYGYLYRTGDKARVMPDGTLECLGRIVSGQVKLRGQRIELGEVEQIISKVDGCHVAVALVIGDNLVVFCAADENESVKQKAMETCKRWLPNYMVPSEIVFLNRLPQLPSGKADKKALEAMYLPKQEEANTSSFEVADETSQAILDVVEEVLQRKVSPNTSLSSVGLDSLRSIRLASLLRGKGHTLGAVDVLSATRFTDLIAICKHNLEASKEAPLTTYHSSCKETTFDAPELREFQSQIADIIPCTPLQEAMLAETMARPDAYCNWVEIELDCSYTFADIKRFLDQLANVNEILRSGFLIRSTTTDSFAQVIWNDLARSQIVEVTQFSKHYSLGSTESLLRPLTIQVNAALQKPRLLFQIPHALYDGWSFDLLLRDLHNIVEGLPLSSRPQYREVVNYYSKIRYRGGLDPSIEYWKRLLEAYHPTPLPNFHGKSVPDNQLRILSGKCGIDVKAIRDCAQEWKINPQVFFQAALAYLTGSYTNTTDVVIGTVTSGRTIPVTGIDEIMGPCIASLPLRVNLSTGLTVKDILDNIHSSNRTMLEHCTIPLRDIKKVCNLRPGLRLFDVLFVWQESLLSDDGDSLAIRTIDSADDLEFKLTLEIEPRKDGIFFKATYDPATIPDAQIRHLTRQMDELVNYFTKNGAFPKERIVDCFSVQTRSIVNPNPLSACIDAGPTSFIERWAAESPEKEALVFGTVVEGAMVEKENISYKTLNNRANRLARKLVHLGVSPNGLVGVLLDKSVNLYVSILAVLKAGAGYLPITPQTPPERVDKILREAGVTFCISESQFSERLPQNGAWTALDLDRMDLSEVSDANLGIPFNGSHLAYVIFTSGSTGTPKGVQVTLKNLMSNLRALSKIYPTSDGPRLLQSCSQGFDVSVFEIFFTWCSGMCLCSATKDDLFYNFEGAINQLRITHLSLTPTVAALADADNVPKVKFLVCAGESLSEHVKKQWAGKGLCNGYGPSETTNIVTLRYPVKTEDASNNIGRPLETSSAFIIEPNDNSIIPRGGVGELCFGGEQICRGYLNRPDLNAIRFINHPTYGRIYRTGDLGLLLPDDSILFYGRFDDQVKIRGQRVELGEINSNIFDLDFVSDCMCVVLGQSDASQRLVAFWVPSDSTDNQFSVLSPERYSSQVVTIFETLALKLPEYMIPTNVIPISQLPTTQQSKVDKAILMNAFQGLSSSFLESTARQSSSIDELGEMTDDEKKIAAALARAVGALESEIHQNSSFFSLGLDSISAIAFSRFLRESGFDHVPVSVLLQNPTISRLSSQIRKSSAIAEANVVTDFSHILRPELLSRIQSDFQKAGKRVERVLPCTPLQEAMLSSIGSASGSAYCNTMIFELTGDISGLQQAWATVFKRHEILRTSFIPTEDSEYAFVQVITPYESHEWDYLETKESVFSDTVEEYVQSAIPRLLQSSQPPVKLTYIQMGDATKLMFCCHHALYDGVAMSQLLHEVEAIYKGIELPLPVGYDGYLKHMLSQNLTEADKFWRKSLSEFEPSFFPDLTGKSVKVESGKSSHSTLVWHLNVAHKEAVGASQQASVSLLPMMQAVWAKLLHFYFGENDLCFGNVVSGRTLPEPDLERLVAPCFNTLPVRVNFDFGKSNSELIRHLHHLNLESMPFQLTPLRRIQTKARKESGHIFDTLFILQQPSQGLDSSIWKLEEDVGDMDVPVVCEISPDNAADTLTLKLHYQHSLLREREAEVIAEAFNYALISCVRFPQLPARDTMGFPSQLLANYNVDYSTFDRPSGPLLHSAFEHNAVARPESTALEFQLDTGEKEVWTFKFLNERANQIAHALIEHGIQIEDVIPVCMGKSSQYYASILGVLKAGAAFAPFHPELPDARKEYMLSEIKGKVLLCVDDSPLSWCGDVPTLNVDSVDAYSKENPTIQNLAPTNLAYCLYTSGSTGLPKAVKMEHRSPIQTVESSRSLLPWNHDTRLLQYAAITFDMCYYDCFIAWTFGFCLCAASQDALLNNVVGVINSMEATLLDLTPSVAAGISKADVPTVKYLYCIGEAMRPEIVQRWEGDCVNSYGPTEAAFCVTIFPVSKDVKTTIIGKPFPTTSFTVFPKQGERALPVFGVGELYIGGAQVARGYSNPSLTESRFVQRNGQRFYKSGDMVRMLVGGNFEFVGRADDQVKIRGLRVELGEINNVLQDSDESITSVTTQILKKDENAKEQLVAFLTPIKSVDGETAATLRNKASQAARSSLPSYMVPQFFIFVDKIPLSRAGKVDKAALTRIFRESEDSQLGADGADSVDHEWTETQSEIRAIFSRLSKTPIEQINPNTTVHQLGLDSISAVQIAAGLRRKGYTISATDVLKNPSCYSLAPVLSSSNDSPISKVGEYDFSSFEQKAQPEICEAYGISPDAIEAVRPCTPLQKGMVSQFISKEGGFYFNYLQLQLDAHVNTAKLQTAWQNVMEKHRMLRTGFVQLQDKVHPFAMVHYKPSSVALPWQETKGQEYPSEEASAWLQASAAETVSNVHLPLWRIRITEENGLKLIDFAMFHALFDAQSLQAIFDDVAAAYYGLSGSSPVPLEPVLATILNSSSADDLEQMRFWRELGPKAAPTRFPNMAPLRLNHSPPAVLSKSCSRSLADIEAGCRQSGITVQAAGLASWASILSAYTGEASVTCGIVLSGRTFESSESAVFPCITTVPFVCRIEENKKAILNQVMSLTAAILKYQFLPINEIQKEMGYPNEPLFDSIFVYQKTANQKSEHELWQVVDEKATVDFPVSIELEPKEGGLEYRLTFLPHIVPQEQAHLILEQLDYFFNGFVFPEASGLNATQYSPLLYSITPAKEPTLPSEATLLHHFVEISAQMYPTRIALEFATSIHHGKYSSKWLNYEQLDAEANRIANMLSSRGVQPGSLVGICFDKCAEASIAIIGILKAGCAFVALDPGAPVARKAYIVKDSGATLVLSMKTTSRDLVSKVEAQVVNLDEVKLASVSTRKPLLRRPIMPQDRSYCLYTSGTTGNPKGCELTHENAVQAMLAFQRLFADHWDENSRWLQFASFHFDVSVLEQFWTWSVGIRLVSAPRDVIFEDLANSIRVLGVTHIDLTPSLARILHPDDVPSLCKGVFITGGESLKQEILDAWGAKGVIYNGYGPTEATIGVTMYPRVPQNGKPSNIGPAFDNVGSYVLRPNSDIPVLRGGIGELCVSGKLVGKGYLNRPELTEERFAHLKRFDERVYRTGDLVRILHDNTFDFLGRADDQVKLRGQRLEIGEINFVIKQSATGIFDVATLVLKHPKQQKEQLVAFVATGMKSSKEPEIILDPVQELATAREMCREKLPGYMIPTHFVALTAMPLSPNNKADGRKLKDMYQALSVTDLQLLSGLSSGKDEAWSQDEQKIRDVLAEVTGIDIKDVRRSSSFFELGLDSISAITFAQRLKQVRFRNAQASLIMKNTSISRLAKALSDKSGHSDENASIMAAQQSITAIQHRHRRAVAEALGVDARDIEALAPTTPLQQGMIARSLESEQALYFNAFHFKLAQGVKEEKLSDSWKTMFQTTQILRTRFANTEDGFVQAVLRKPAFPWKAASVDDSSKVDTTLNYLQQEWRSQNRVVMKRPFELVLLTTPSARIMVIHIFHALYDGNSIGLVLKAVLDIYHSRWNGDSGPAFQTALPYGPLRISEGAKEFWQKHMYGASSQPLPTLSSECKPAIMITREVGGLSGYEATRRKLNVTPLAIVQACWATVLQTYFKGATTLGMVLAGRSLDFDGAERVIGPLFNTIPYHHRVSAGDKWSAVIKQCHDFNVASHSYQHTPLRDIRKWCKTGANQPLFDNLFVYQQDTRNTKVAEKNDLWELIDDDSDPDYPLAIEVEQRGAAMLKLTLVAKGNVIDEGMAGALLDQFERGLRQVLENSDRPVGSVKAEEEIEDQEEADEEIIMGGLDAASDFKWTEKATAIREEIANLAEARTEEVSESTSILELGLDSIDAIKLSSKLKKRGIDLNVSAIMRGLTITNMVLQISNNSPEKFAEASDMVFRSHKRRLEKYLHRKGLASEDIERILPLTPLQEAMVAEMLASEYKRYYNHDVVKVDSSVNIQQLQQAWNTVIKRSPILRTSFIEVDDPNIDFSYAQVIHKASASQWLETETNDSDFAALIESVRKGVANSTTETPLFKVRHIKCQGQSYLVLTIAHALYDGWSLGLLHEDIHYAYSGQFKPRPDYEPALREILTTSGSDAAAFWRDYLSDAKGILFPRRQHAGINRVHRDESSSKIPLSQITSFTRKNNLTLQTLGQTVYSLVLASYLQSLDVVFGSVLSGRDNDAMQDILFPTMNTVAIRTILHGTKREMLRYVQDNFTAVKQWQHFPLRKAQGVAGVKGALFDTLFIYQKRVEGGGTDANRLYESVQGQSDVEYPVCVEMEIVEDALVWRCACKEEAFSEMDTKDLLKKLDQVLKDMIERVDEATVTFGEAGTAIGGLPAFTDGDDSGFEDLTESSPDITRPTSSQASPATAQVIREILAFVSKVPEDEITDDMTIFHIGLDSISAIKVSSLLRKRSIVLSVGDMLRAGTVEKMAQVADDRNVSSEQVQDDGDETLSIILKDVEEEECIRRSGVAPEEVEQVFPASAGQIYMLSTWLNSRGTVFYPEFKFVINGALGFKDLQQAWEKLIATHSILRTTFVATQSSATPYAQLVLRYTKTSIFDTTNLNEEAECKMIRETSSKQPFVSVFATQSQPGWALKLKIHHALYDGVSLPELMRQLQDLCNGKQLPPQPNTLRNFLAATTNETVLAKRREFWTSYLKGVSQASLPQPSQISGARTEVFTPALIPSIHSLEQLSRKHGLSVQSLFVAVYSKIYAALLHTPDAQDVVIGIYLANRSHAISGLSSAAVPTVNLVPLRVSAPLGTSLVDAAAQIQYDIQEISGMTNASVGLWEIEQWTGVKVDTFVNFLKLPGALGDDEQGGEIVIREAGGLANGAFARTSEVKADNIAEEGILEELRNEVNGSYAHAIDVEASVRMRGLDVGVFGSVEVIGLEGGEELVGDVKMALEGLK